MLLTLDVGNTNITLGVYAGDTLRFVSRMATNPPRMEDQYAADLLAILKLYGVEPEEITGVIMSSVVPGLTAPLTRAVRRVRRSSSARRRCRTSRCAGTCPTRSART